MHLEPAVRAFVDSLCGGEGDAALYFDATPPVIGGVFRCNRYRKYPPTLSRVPTVPDLMVHHAGIRAAQPRLRKSHSSQPLESDQKGPSPIMVSRRSSKPSDAKNDRHWAGKMASYG